MKQIILSTGRLCKVSDEDYDYLNQWTWHISHSNDNSVGYATNTIKGLMHHVILERMGSIIKINMEADHKDRDHFNNQRENLRIVTLSISKHNRGLFKNNRTGCKGVYFDERKG